MNAQTLETDVFVIGGGPAGLGAAIAARAQGLRVTVADRQHPPIDKACGEGLMPNAVAALEKLGVQFAAGEAMPFRGIRFLDGQTGLSTEAAFSNGAGLAVRRTNLHSKLVERAAQAGAALLWDATVDLAERPYVKCGGARVNGRWIIGADGFQSQVRAWAGLNAGVRRPTRFGFTQHFEMRPWTDFVEVYWGANCQAAVTPTGPGEIGIAVLSRDPQMRLPNALQQMPVLADRIKSARPISRERGAPCALRRFPRVYRKEIALIGDASGSVDPVTGEGLGLSFQQAISLAAALNRGDLKSYQAAHRRIARHSYQMSQLISFVDRRSWLRQKALRALSSEPALFGRMLETNMGERNASGVGSGALRLGWRMARLAWPF